MNPGPRVAIIVAMDRKGVIGRDGRLPWHLPADLKYFRRITMGKPIVMGRHTHQSLGRPLPGRLNIVVSRNPAYQAEGCRVVASLCEACRAAGEAEEIMVIGGASLYREALPLAASVYLTEVHADVGGDVRFPPFDRSQWKEVAREDHAADAANAHAYSFVLLHR